MSQKMFHVLKRNVYFTHFGCCINNFVACSNSEAREAPELCSQSIMGSENLEVQIAHVNMGIKDCAHELSNGKLYQKLNHRQRAWCCFLHIPKTLPRTPPSV